MARIEDVPERHRLTAQLVPGEIREQISTAELLDRVRHAEDLSARAQAATDPVLKREYARLAKAAVDAPARADAEAQAAGYDRAGLVAKAAEVREAIAPRRPESVAIAKAGKVKLPAGDVLVVCYDEHGRAWGVVPKSKIKPVTPPGTVTKARPRHARRP